MRGRFVAVGRSNYLPYLRGVHEAVRGAVLQQRIESVAQFDDERAISDTLQNETGKVGL